MRVTHRFLIRQIQRAGVVAALFALVVGCSSDDPVPYGELLVVGDQVTIRSFGVNADGVPTQLGSAMIPGIPGTYSRTGDVVTVTIAYHNVPDGSNILLDFSPGTGGTATDGMYVATVVDEDNFTVVDSASGDITDGMVLRSPAVQYGATYSQADTTVTITLPGHNLESGDGVDLDFTSGTAVDTNKEIETIVDEDTFTVLVEDPLTTSGNVDVVVGANYTIFGAAMHPNGRWLYVTSTYECYQGEPYCWGNDLITRFAIDWFSGQLTFEESYRTFGGDDEDDAAPVTLVFSADGTRLLNQDDDLDGLQLWEVNTTTGDLMKLDNTAANTTRQHGIAISADGTRAYHGSVVFTIGTDSIARTTEGTVGESNQILGPTMFTILRSEEEISALSLADPDAPAVIASSGETPHDARDLALLDGGSLIVASGWGGLKSYDYDGAAITESVGAGETELRDGGMSFEDIQNMDVRRMYRTISRNGAGTLVAAAYFTHDDENNAGQGGLQPSGFILVDVAADGSLALAGDFPVATYARVARFISRPVE